MLRCLLYIFHVIKQQKIYIKNKNCLQFLFIVKAAVLKQQISKFYPQILSTQDSLYIYGTPLTEINVVANLWRNRRNSRFLLEIGVEEYDGDVRF